jgi:pimeloyl-ACP methyl ester carboxylesterase
MRTGGEDFVKRLPFWFTRTIGVIGTVAPFLGSEIAYQLFYRLGTPSRVRESEQRVHDRAITSEIEVSGKRVVVYRWGGGKSVILLVHGWRSRGSRFAALVAALERDDRTIITFDAPGNGASGGNRTSILEYIDAITQIAAKHSTFDAVVGHSFGVTAAFVAKREGVAASRLVSIAGVYDFHFVVETFARQIGLPTRAISGLNHRIAHRFFPEVSDLWRRFVAELDPTDTQTPVLVIQDDTDAEVALEQAVLIAESNTGPTDLMITHGLGHSRVLTDPVVIARVAEFLG